MANPLFKTTNPQFGEIDATELAQEAQEALEEMESIVMLGQWTGPLAVAANLMDDEIRERLHNEMAPCEDQDFLDAYAAAHLVKFGETFQVN